MKNTLIALVGVAVILGGYVAFSRQATAPDTQDTPDATTTDTGRIRGPEDATLSVGETATIAGVTVTLNKVSSDSRCPAGVQCIWAGTVTSLVTLELNGETKTLELTLDADSVEFGGYLVSLFAVAPATVKDVRINPTDYRLTFHVESKIGSDGNIPANI